MPEQPASEAVQSESGLNLRIMSVVIFNFASYLTIGLPLAVLPGYVHGNGIQRLLGGAGGQPAIFFYSVGRGSGGAITYR